LPYPAIAALQKQPDFADACRSFTRGFIDLYQGNRLLNTLVNDRGRMIISNLALYLHYGHRDNDPRSGLTVSRLKTICVEQQVCSAGRTEAIVAVLRLFGFLVPAPSAQDRRVRRLVPTERMLTSQRQRWSVTFMAAGLVLPDARAAHNAIAREEFMAALSRQFAEHFLSGIRLLHHSTELKLFTDRNAGLMVLFSLLNAGAPDDSFPPRGPVVVSISGLARRFGVSRVHVRKLLRDAAAAGFIERSDDSEGPVILLPRFIIATQNFLATMLLFVAYCARAALDDIDAGTDATASEE
jgi:DNA-binding MarR family transcriptional regulator